MPSFAFRTSLSEDSGVRAGLALTEAEMLAHLPADHPLRAGLEQDVAMRVASDDYADTVGDLLFALGTVDEPGMPTITERLTKLVGRDWRSWFSLDEVMTVEAVGAEYLRRRVARDPSQDELHAELHALVPGKPGASDAIDTALELHLAFSPYFTREDRADDLTTLSTLFESENLPSNPGRFFDQRFINYLHANPNRLPEVHWRQFEALTAEWFAHEGYQVELGTGRNDDGIDVRAWKRNAEPGSPPALVVQCKRQKGRVDKTIVKALHGDVQWEGADQGMIVTTSDISPGAANTIQVRRYPIVAANRLTVERWVAAMRKPWSGVVAGGVG